MRRRCSFLSELDGLADAVSAVEFVGGGPDDFRDDGEEGGEEVGDGEVQDEVVHPTHLQTHVALEESCVLVFLETNLVKHSRLEAHVT